MRAEKQFLLDEMQEMIEKSDAFVVTSCGKMLANTASDFRKQLREADADFEVVRKRVFLKAADAAGVEGLKPEDLTGSIGIVFASGDTVNATKAVCKFAEDNGAVLEVLSGHFDGKMLNASEVETLSKLPGREEMRAMLLGTLEAPMSHTLGVMDALLTSVPHCLANKAAESES